MARRGVLTPAMEALAWQSECQRTFGETPKGTRETRVLPRKENYEWKAEEQFQGLRIGAGAAGENG
jgi:hypothetical protein